MLHGTRKVLFQMSVNLTQPLSKLGFGAFHIGRIPGLKYASQGSPIPSEEEVTRLLHQVIDCGITLVDTAPAYGLSEERIGKSLHSRRMEFNLCSKVGENFNDGKSIFSFAQKEMRNSLEQSLRRLNTEYLDILLIHAPENDLSVLNETDAVETMIQFKNEGKTRAIGFSGKSVEAQTRALEWSDVMMIEYSIADQSMEPLIRQTNKMNKCVLIKKALQSGHSPAKKSIQFLHCNSPVQDCIDCTVIGSKNASRMNKNVKEFIRLGLLRD